MKFGEWLFVGLCLLWVAWLGVCIYALTQDGESFRLFDLIIGVPSLFVTYLWWDRHYGSVFNRR